MKTLNSLKSFFGGPKDLKTAQNEQSQESELNQVEQIDAQE